MELRACGGPTAAFVPRGALHDFRFPRGTGVAAGAAMSGSNVTRAFRALRDVDSGIFYVNAPTIGAEVQLPFGGMKGTGNGFREAGPHALDEFSEWKAVSIDFSHRLQKAQFQPGE